jgi:hypothetical protein
MSAAKDFAELVRLEKEGARLIRDEMVATVFLLLLRGARPPRTHQPSSNSLFDGLFEGDPDFTVFNGEVLFVGSNTQHFSGLWVTDSTASAMYLSPLILIFQVI